jgi:DNA-binding transcriptional LysR family regulator
MATCHEFVPDGRDYLLGRHGMARDDFNDLLVFMEVANERSFTKAAANLGLSQSTLSHTMRRLETRLGLRLLTRTTRNVAPTDVGERLLRTLEPRIKEIQSDITALMEFRDKPSGTVRLTVSDYALHETIWPKLAPLLKQYPDIKIEIGTENKLTDIVEGRFDAGVRLGESLEKDMIAVRIGADWRLVVVGSQSYFADHPVPEHPQELIHHNCINHRMMSAGGILSWEFENAGRALKVKVEGQLTFNSVYPMVEAALDGNGLAYVPESLVIEHVRAGRLKLVLDEWSPFFSGFYLYYPSRRQISPAFAIVIDALRQR